jgi:hypothetical protein
MHGGVILFRGSGSAALRYVEADRGNTDEYYLGGDAVARFVALDGTGAVVAASDLVPEAYSGWVDWMNPVTGLSMGTPRLAGSERGGSPRFFEMTVNGPKSLSIAAALHPDVSEALDAAQQAAADEIARWLALHSTTRVGPRGRQESVPVQQLQVVRITHRTSRAGDPHRHIHFQIGARVYAAGRWRGLENGALLGAQQGTIRAIGTAVIAAHPKLAETLAAHGLTLDHVTGEVKELQPYNDLMSKRGAQVEKNLDRLVAKWEAAHPGEMMGPVVFARLVAKAWAFERPAKRPAKLADEAEWLTELREAGYDSEVVEAAALVARGVAESRALHPAVALDDLTIQAVASRALDRCAAAQSAWTRHTVQEHVARVTTGYGVRATPEELRQFIDTATTLAIDSCFSILPPGAAMPEHVARLTSIRVVQAETELRDLLAAMIPVTEPGHPDVSALAEVRELDPGQVVAAAAVASTAPLVIVEGAAGSGKTTMLKTAIDAAAEHGGVARVVAPTRRAAQVAQDELGVPATSVAALVHAHGWRWNDDGVWTRLAVGDTDPDTGRTYDGPSPAARLARSERVIVDEAGMLDQDTSLALLHVLAETGATVALIGDRAQLPAVGRGGVLDMAAQIRGRTFDMAEVHRFTDPDYAALTLAMRDRDNPAVVFDRLTALGLVHLHESDDELRDHIAASRRDGEAVTVATNDEVATLNERIRAERVAAGEVDDTVTVTGSDGLPIGAGDLIQTRRNDSALGVANRQNWIVQQITEDGTVWASEASTGRKRPRTVALPAEYINENAHLAYASTAYGVQGVTVNASHTVLSESMSGASVYVGMTRGKESNTLHVVAESLDEAREIFIEALERDRADRGLTLATVKAQEAVSGIIANGPVAQVTAEAATLTAKAEEAEERAAWWANAATQLGAQTEQHQGEKTEAADALTAAREQVEAVSAEVRAPLIAEAIEDVRPYLAALGDEADAARELRHASRFGKQKARRAHQAASDRVTALRQSVRARWGEAPYLGQNAEVWASRVADAVTASAPTVQQVARTAQNAAQRQVDTERRHRTERRTVLSEVYGEKNVTADPARWELANPEDEAAKWQREAAEARAEAARLRDLTPAEAAAHVEAKRQAAEAKTRADAERVRKLRAPFERNPFGNSRRPGPTDRGLARGL